MTYITNVVIGGILIICLYEFLVLPLLVGKPHSLWGRWPIEAQSDVYERGFQNAMAIASQEADRQAKCYAKPIQDGLVDHGLQCKSAAATYLAMSIRAIAAGEPGHIRQASV